MADRVYVAVCGTKAACDALRDAWDFATDDPRDDPRLVEMEEWVPDTDELVALANEGHSFEGNHGSRYEIEPGLFAAHGGEFVHVRGETRPWVACDRTTGWLDIEELDAVFRYVRLRAEAIAAMKADEASDAE